MSRRNNMGKKFIFALAILFSAADANACKFASEKNIRFQAPDFNFTLDAPSGWLVSRQDDEISFSKPAGGACEYTYATIKVMSFYGNNDDIKSIAAEGAKRVGYDLSKYEPTDKHEYTSYIVKTRQKNISGVILEHKPDKNRDSLAIGYIRYPDITPAGDIYVVLVMSAKDTADFTKLVKDLEQIISSFKERNDRR